jgi:hypothetical protein
VEKLARDVDPFIAQAQKLIRTPLAMTVEATPKTHLGHPETLRSGSRAKLLTLHPIAYKDGKDLIRIHR